VFLVALLLTSPIAGDSNFAGATHALRNPCYVYFAVLPPLEGEEHSLLFRHARHRLQAMRCETLAPFIIGRH
jgi:hypothetical protein